MSCLLFFRFLLGVTILSPLDLGEESVFSSVISVSKENGLTKMFSQYIRAKQNT